MVILRCKGDALHGPAETVIDGGDETGFAATSRAPSVAHSAPAAKARDSARPAPKAPAKEPSVAADDGLGGGMFGLFDGAGDDPDYRRHMPGRYDHRSPLPRYRQDLRNDNRYSPRPFTVHGDSGDRNAGDVRAHAYDVRPRTANDHYALPVTPHAGYDFQQRRRFVPHTVQQSPTQRHENRPLHNAYTPRAPPSSLLPRVSAPEGFSFVLETCKEMDGLYRLSFGEREKCAELAQEAHAWENDPEMYLSAMKALRHKQQELGKADEQLTAMRQAIYARMRRMDPKTWQYTRDFLVLEARLFGPNDPHMQQWPDPRLQQHLQSPELGTTRTSGAIDDRTGHNPRSNDGWEEQGHGETNGGLQQKQMRKQSGAHSARSSIQKPAGDGWGASSQKGGGNWATDDVDNQANDGGAGDAWGGAAGGNDDQNKDDSKSESKKDGTGAWGANDNGQSNNEGDNGWGANNDKNDSKQDGGDWGGGGDNNDTRSKTAGWHNNDGAGSHKSRSQNNDAWAQSTKDNKSQTAKSKIDSWAKGNQKSQSAAWGNQSQAKTQQGGNGGWNQVGAGEGQARSHASSRRPARTTTSVALEPVIKPYWADWDKPQQGTSRPRPQPRDPYEYPPPATVLAPSGRARDLSHGVQAGRGADYAHKTFRPEYLDTMDKPYAIFTFKYRSQSTLEKLLRRKIDTSDTKRAVDEAEKEKLMRLPKDELVQEMLKMRLKPSSSGTKPASAPTAPSNTGWGVKAPSQANWGGDQQRDDVKPSDSVSNHTSVKRGDGGGGVWAAAKSKANDGGWDSGKNDNGGDAWNQHDKQSRKNEAKKQKSKVSAWDAAPAAGENDQWAANGAGKDKASSRSESHFAPDDPGLQTAGDGKLSQGWADAGW